MPKSSLFDVPAPIKQLFDSFPLHTYHPNDLPHRAPKQRNAHVLYTFTTPHDAARGAPSYNPTCLKWQAYLAFSHIPIRIAPSNNHASPSGSLPFLQPATPEPSKQPAQPVPSHKLQKWAQSHSAKRIDEPSDPRYEAYLSLLDHRVRRAWLYAVYLSPHNGPALAEPLYILPPSRNPLVRLSVARTLRAAALAELRKHASSGSAAINADALYTQAEDALAALDALLDSHTWFFGAQAPGLFDASVFAYTHLLLDAALGAGWVDTRLRDAVCARPRLVAHRQRILDAYFSVPAGNA